MKATELRIGNLVNYQLTDEMSDPKNWIEPMVIDAEDLRVLSLREYEEYTPLPLTEDWLKRLGFTKEPDEPYFYGTPTKIQDITLEVCVEDYRVILFDNKRTVFVDLKYTESVHQLQNLFFAVTGEELPINNIPE